MALLIQYTDKFGRSRSRRFNTATEALKFATNPPEGVAEIKALPGETESVLSRVERDSREAHEIPRSQISTLQSHHDLSLPPVVDSTPLMLSWSRPNSHLPRRFKDINEAALTLIKRYSDGWAPNKLSHEFHVHRDTIKFLLIANCIPLRAERYRNLQDARPGWQNAFSEPTPSALYWAGFLMADGSISARKKRPSIDCRINTKDISQIEALCEFVGRGKLFFSWQAGILPLVGWRVSSQKIADDLARWGIVPLKGRRDDAQPLGEARMSVDFWRGMIDGDGNIQCKGASPQVQLTGRMGISQAFIKFVEAKINLVLYRGPRLRIHKYPKGSATKVILNGQNAVALCEFLYMNAPAGLYLKRKHKAALEVIRQYKGAQHGRGKSVSRKRVLSPKRSDF